MNKRSITKHNGLVQASYRLSLNETRIVLYALSSVNPLANDYPLEYEIKLRQ